MCEKAHGKKGGIEEEKEEERKKSLRRI